MVHARLSITLVVLLLHHDGLLLLTVEVVLIQEHITTAVFAGINVTASHRPLQIKHLCTYINIYTHIHTKHDISLYCTGSLTSVASQAALNFLLYMMNQEKHELVYMRFIAHVLQLLWLVRLQ